MKICLSMIVKNESAVIERCLRSVKPLIHAWAISDTGSTDGTQDIIRSFMADLPGELIERPWVDFSTNRNEALELARKHGDYALLIDADDRLQADRFTELTADCYYFTNHLASLIYRMPHLLRLSKGFFYRGVTHEYLDCSTAYTRADMPDVIYHRGDDSSRRIGGKKFVDDAALLTKGLAAEPDNARYQFYLAQSWRDGGQLQEALSAYEKRVGMGGWPEEVYYSKWQVALLKEKTSAAYAEIVAAYLDAYDFRPSRAEAPCDLARYCRLNKRYAAAREFARIATALPLPNDLLFIDATVYAWRARDELSIAEYWCGNYAESARLCRELLADTRLPESERPRVQANLDFSLPHLPAARD